MRLSKRSGFAVRVGQYTQELDILAVEERHGH